MERTTAQTLWRNAAIAGRLTLGFHTAATRAVARLHSPSSRTTPSCRLCTPSTILPSMGPPAPPPPARLGLNAVAHGPRRPPRGTRLSNDPCGE